MKIHLSLGRIHERVLVSNTNPSNGSTGNESSWRAACRDHQLDAPSLTMLYVGSRCFCWWPWMVWSWPSLVSPLTRLFIPIHWTEWNPLDVNLLVIEEDSLIFILLQSRRGAELFSFMAHGLLVSNSWIGNLQLNYAVYIGFGWRAIPVNITWGRGGWATLGFPLIYRNWLS